MLLTSQGDRLCALSTVWFKNFGVSRFALQWTSVLIVVTARLKVKQLLGGFDTSLSMLAGALLFCLSL